MYLICDTRQQEGKHKNIEQYCKRKGITLIRQCLSVGDYMVGEMIDGEVKPVGNISIDTKENCLEICSNICSSDHRRFKAECERSKLLGVQLIVLVEEMTPFGEIDLWEVPRWQTSGKYHRYGDPMTMVEPKTLKKAMQTMTEKYGVQFRFSHRKHTASKLIKYLKGELK